jgi:hypothetical protein
VVRRLLSNLSLGLLPDCHHPITPIWDAGTYKERCDHFSGLLVRVVVSVVSVSILSPSHLFAIDHLFAILSGKLKLGSILLLLSLIIFISTCKSYIQIPREIRAKLPELDDF